MKTIALVVLLFVGVYLPAFVANALIKPRPQAAVPLVIGVSLAMAFVFIYFLSSDTTGLSQFGFKPASQRYVVAAIALGVPISLGLTFLLSRFQTASLLDKVSFHPWMIVVYFIIGAPIQEEAIFRGLLQTTLECRLGIIFSFLGVTLSFASVAIAVLFGLIHIAVGAMTAVVALVLGLLAGN
jgi:membrane protease YdiL (CAAX protease family)